MSIPFIEEYWEIFKKKASNEKTISESESAAIKTLGRVVSNAPRNKSNKSADYTELNGPFEFKNRKLCERAILAWFGFSPGQNGLAWEDNKDQFCFECSKLEFKEWKRSCGLS